MALEELQNGRYRRLRLLGTGGMGEVYLMQDTRVSRQVAIKVIRSEGISYPGSDAAKDAARLFQREAKAIAALEHPNILPLYDFGEETHEDTTMTYMVMPFVSEGSLAGWLRQRESDATLSLQDIAYVVEQAAEALQYAHDHQLIHLDVKPSNFLLRSNRKQPNRPTLLLADFGIARSSATVAKASRAIRGTPTAMAPEQWSSEPVAASDQYALAVMTYELLVGRPPFVGSMEQLMYQHFNVAPPAPSTFNPQLPAAIDTVLLRALAKKPAERFPSITAFATAFEQAAQQAPAGLVVGARPPGVNDITRDMRTTLAISKAEAHSGTNRVITLPGDQQVNVTVPAGVYDGQVIRVPELAASSSSLDELILTIAIKPPEEESHLSADTLSTEPTLLPSHFNVSSTEAYPPPGTLSAEPTLLPSHFSAQQPAERVASDELPTLAASASDLQIPERQAQPAEPAASDELPTPAASVSDPQIPERQAQPGEPAASDDPPRPTSSASDLQAAEKQQPAPLPERRPVPRSRIVAIISAVIILLLLAGAVYLYSSHQASVNAIAHSQTATAGVRPAQTPTQVPTVASTPTVKPQNGLYIAGTYNGSMVNEVTQQTTTFTIFLGQSKGNAALSGTVVFRSPSTGTYPLKGTVDTRGNFSFTVQQSAGQTPLVFYGTFQQDYLKGNFCSSSTNSCSASTGYFSAGPRS